MVSLAVEGLMETIRFDGRVAVITGAGGGLGRAYALLLASRGASVVVNDLGGGVDGSGRGSSMADAVVGEIKGRGGKAAANYDSVATPEGGEAIIKSAIDAFGRVDIVINNAGILRDKSFVNMSPAELDAVLDVHLKGAFFVSQPAFRVMKEQKYGRFLFTSSAAGLFGNFGQANYGAAKMGLVGLAHVLAIEGLKHNIRANVISPIAKTRLSEGVLGAFGDEIDPALVAPMAAYLVSEASEATHEIYSAGGGRFSRVFIGLTPGWFAGPTPPSLEEIQSHLSLIRETGGFSTPMSATDEFAELAQRRQR